MLGNLVLRSARVGSFGGLCGVPMEVPGMKNSTPTEDFSVEVHFGGT